MNHFKLPEWKTCATCAHSFYRMGEHFSCTLDKIPEGKVSCAQTCKDYISKKKKEKYERILLGKWMVYGEKEEKR